MGGEPSMRRHLALTRVAQLGWFVDSALFDNTQLNEGHLNGPAFEQGAGGTE
jgi:hypothetical protein